jgi:hypothetical protein
VPENPPLLLLLASMERRDRFKAAAELWHACRAEAAAKDSLYRVPQQPKVARGNEQCSGNGNERKLQAQSSSSSSCYPLSHSCKRNDNGCATGVQCVRAMPFPLHGNAQQSTTAIP